MPRPAHDKEASLARARKQFAERLQLLTAFSHRLTQLSTDEWRRLREGCADLDSTSFGALIARAQLAAQPFQMRMPVTKDIPTALALKAIGGASRAFMSGMCFAYEVISEFESNPRAPAAPRPQTDRPPMDAAAAAYADAMGRIMAVTAEHGGSGPGVNAAVHAASQAVVNGSIGEPSAIAAAYRYLEPVIPFASLKPAA